MCCWFFLHFTINIIFTAKFLKMSQISNRPQSKKHPALNICAFEGSQFMTWGFLWKVCEWASTKPLWALHQEPLSFKINNKSMDKKVGLEISFSHFWPWWHNDCSRWKVLRRNGGRRLFSLDRSTRQSPWLSLTFLTFYYTNKNRRLIRQKQKRSRACWALF